MSEKCPTCGQARWLPEPQWHLFPEPDEDEWREVMPEEIARRVFDEGSLVTLAVRAQKVTKVRGLKFVTPVGMVLGDFLEIPNWKALPAGTRLAIAETVWHPGYGRHFRAAPVARK